MRKHLTHSGENFLEMDQKKDTFPVEFGEEIDSGRVVDESRRVSSEECRKPLSV